MGGIGKSKADGQQDSEPDLADARLLSIPPADAEKTTHQLFRFPAKFHPPIVRALVETYSRPGDRILDPFCGSGTLLVEAAVMGRKAFGIDVDPLAVFVSRAKTTVYDTDSLQHETGVILEKLLEPDRGNQWYIASQHRDLSERQYKLQSKAVTAFIPDIPNLHHWFRRYVVVDLARIAFVLDSTNLKDETRLFLKLVFASIIRNCSNADPVPVSGLEVTRHMLEREARGRVVNPFSLFRTAAAKALVGVGEFARLARSSDVRCMVGDATAFPKRLPKVNCVITSPPYNNAVDYYRRHQLEMYWLKLVETRADRLAILPQYIGRHKVPMSHPFFQREWAPGPLADYWESAMRKEGHIRANAFKHYVLSMQACFQQTASVTQPDAPVIMVVGRSTWNRQEIPTDALMQELAGDAFKLAETLWYPVINRYMSYTRKNSANISREYALVFRRLD